MENAPEANSETPLALYRLVDRLDAGNLRTPHVPMHHSSDWNS